MLCIASFLVLLLLSAVSAQFRPLAKRAWSCASRRLTLRPCDTTFRDDVKNTLLAPLALRAPRWVKPASVAIEAVAWVMVISMVTSIYILLRSGLNFAVYGTCNKHNPEACVVTAEVCGIPSEDPTFLQSIRSGHIITAFRNEFTAVADTISTIPSRLRSWDATEFLPEYATFRGGYDPTLPTALEVLDPGCGICAQLFRNAAEAGFADRYNISYIAYPIVRDGSPQFPNSELIARYLTALRISEQADPRFADRPTDWAILSHIFTENQDGTKVLESSPASLSWQFYFNNLASTEDATHQLHTWLREAGYSDAEIVQIDELAQSPQVTEVLAHDRGIVENEIRTVAIPTLIADGRLHRGSVSVEDLREMGN